MDNKSTMLYKQPCVCSAMNTGRKDGFAQICSWQTCGTNVGYSGDPFSSKTNIFKFQFDQKSGGRRTTVSGFATSKSLFVYLFIIYLFIKYSNKI